MDSLKLSRWISIFAVILAFVVVILGAYTRLTDAGLGCPDWPGCYGHWVVPETQQAIQQVDQLYPKQPLEPAKAWAEMVHRYAAGTLGVFILILSLLIFKSYSKGDKKSPVAASIFLILLVLFQAALGRWTVTLQLLPVVVMGHLMGGMFILAILWYLMLKLNLSYRWQENSNFDSNTLLLNNFNADKKFRFWAILGLIIVILQISLGGWTSTNYAALACADFPTCQGQWLPLHGFREAFNFFMPVGMNFEGGVLNTAARVTIQATHRLGALITGVYLILLSLSLFISAKKPLLKRLGIIILLVLAIQITLGMMNVLMLLPLKVAILHNAFAAVLLITLVTLSYVLYAKPPRENG